MEKRPLAAGDTVYLENDHPFTVEEIGIFDVHLRDEDFPLIGRAAVSYTHLDVYKRQALTVMSRGCALPKRLPSALPSEDVM